MKRWATRPLVMTLIAVMTLMIMCGTVSHAAKKTYKIPVKIKTQDGVVMKITYKKNTVKFSMKGEGSAKYTHKGKNRYAYKSSLYYINEKATLKTKSGHVTSLNGTSDGHKFTTKYSYKSGKPYKCVKTETFTSEDADYKKTKIVTKIKSDKHGNVKKAIISTTNTKFNGKVKKESSKDVYRNTYKGGSLKKSATTYYGKSGKHWAVEYADVRSFTYKKVKLTKKQYKKYKPIIEYLIRDYSIRY